MSIALTSPAFSEGNAIPKRHAGEGENLSPALSWSTSAPSVQSYVLLVEDPDAPAGTFIHWILFNIPSGVHQLAEGLPEKADISGVGQQGMNDARKTGYSGPYPPPGKPHRYFFKIFALDRMLGLPSGCSYTQVNRVLQEHILDSGSLMGTYRR
jgi:Raf kinase inhibitor-like YbhB/YbcL family protein